MNDREIDEMLKIDEEAENSAQLKRKLKKSVNKQIYSRILLTLLALAIIIGGGSWAKNIYLEKTSYNPLQEDEMMSFEREGNGFAYLMELYLNMLNGGGVVWNIQYDQSDGSGEYQYFYTASSFFDLFNRWQYGFSNAYGSWGWMNVSHSKLVQEEKENGITYQIIEQQNREVETSLSRNSLQKVYQEIQRLPETCLFDVSVYFPEEKNMDEIADFINQNPNIIYNWMARKVDEQFTFKSGMSLAGLQQNSDSYRELKLEVLNEYPSLVLYQNGKVSGEILTEHYLSTLRLLLDHEDFMNVIETAYNGVKAELQHAYDEVLSDGLYGKALRCVISQPELLALIESGEIESVCVYDLKLSYLEQ